MKRNIVESYSMEEAFGALNSKPAVKRAAEQLTEGISKSSLVRWLKNNADQEVSTEDFDTLVDNLWGVIEKENEERKFYKQGYRSIEEVDVPQLIDSSDNPVHDIGYKLLGWDDLDDEYLDESKSHRDSKKNDVIDNATSENTPKNKFMVSILGEREPLQYYQTLEEAERAFKQLSNKGHNIILIDLSTGRMLKSEFDNPGYKSTTEGARIKSLHENNASHWLDIQNQIALEQQDGINPLYEDSTAGDYILELMGKVEKELDVAVIPSVQGGYGNVYIHLGDTYANSGEPVGPLDFTEFSNEMIDLILEADTEKAFIDAYRRDILAYIEE